MIAYYFLIVVISFLDGKKTSKFIVQTLATRPSSPAEAQSVARLWGDSSKGQYVWKVEYETFFFFFLLFWLNLKFINFYRHWLLLVFVNPLRPSFLFGFSDLQWIYFPGMKIRDQAISEILGLLKISIGKSFWNYWTICFMEKGLFGFPLTVSGEFPFLISDKSNLCTRFKTVGSHQSNTSDLYLLLYFPFF